MPRTDAAWACGKAGRGRCVELAVEHLGDEVVGHITKIVVCVARLRKPPPKRVPNRTVRSREYLTPDEVEKLIRTAARMGRHRHRNATLILVAYRHGLRVGELVSLRWDQVDFTEALLRVTRSKNGTASNHPIGARETRALRRLRRIKVNRCTSS